MKILFVDMACKEAYDSGSLDQALGGSEATLVRVVDGLTARGIECRVVQEPRLVDTGNYLAIDKLLDKSFKPTHVVVMRVASAVPTVKKLYRDAKLYFWMHDWAEASFMQDVDILEDAGATILCVSQTHKHQVKDLLHFYSREIRHLKDMRVEYIYNPVIVPTIEPKPVDNNKLVFLSSPHKGIEQVIERFEILRQGYPNLELHICSPGYFGVYGKPHKNVINHGMLSHAEVLELLNGAFCLFYPQAKFPETFGLVYAEANALGVPVLAYNFGAAGEVLQPAKDQLIPDVLFDTVYNKFHSWQNGNRPVTSLKEEFRLEAVLNHWVRLLEAK